MVLAFPAVIPYIVPVLFGRSLTMWIRTAMRLIRSAIPDFVMPGLDPGSRGNGVSPAASGFEETARGIHAHPKTWMAGTTPAMTIER